MSAMIQISRTDLAILLRAAQARGGVDWAARWAVAQAAAAEVADGQISEAILTLSQASDAWEIAEYAEGRALGFAEGTDAERVAR
ncbi:MAG: hypothetical protein IT537_08185 [Hyphomicrobiales bacterium]|nr:hypothetical protein [Hyphomicrobiales bacterium]